jgi:hypothetical protein
MNKRRGFLKGLGLFSAVVAGAVAPGHTAAEPVLAGTPVPVDNSGVTGQAIDHLAPASCNHSSIRFAGYNEVAPPIPTGAFPDSTSFYIAPSQKETNFVELSVGKDDRLWMKIGDSWKRIAIEG